MLIANRYSIIRQWYAGESYAETIQSSFVELKRLNTALLAEMGCDDDKHFETEATVGFAKVADTIEDIYMQLEYYNACRLADEINDVDLCNQFNIVAIDLVHQLRLAKEEVIIE